MSLKMELFLFGLIMIFAVPFFAFFIKEIRSNKKLAKDVNDGFKLVANEVGSACRWAIWPFGDF